MRPRRPPGTPAGARHPRVDIDFDRCTVEAAFLGRTANSEGLEADSVTERPNAVVVRFNFPATGAGVEPHTVRPYGFVVLPCTEKPIVLEQDEGQPQGRHVDPPDWQEAGRLPNVNCTAAVPPHALLNLTRWTDCLFST